MTKEKVFVCLGQHPIMGGGSAEGVQLLRRIRRKYHQHYDVSECVLDWRSRHGRGSCGHFEWREPSLSPAFAVIVAPIVPFEDDITFDLARHRTAFTINTLVLHRVIKPGHKLDLGNVTFTMNKSALPAEPTSSKNQQDQSALQTADWAGSVSDAMEKISRFLY